jgi:4-diphosphocytidyl-2-C-methyl-D-erythritol kinase
VIRRPATAKINLGLVVGPLREDGRHELVTVLQRIDLADRVSLRSALGLHVRGFPADTLVRDALSALADAAGVEPAWEATITKRIPVAAGLGGGSSDAATALGLANGLLADPLPADRLGDVAREIGADVPFFLTTGPQLAVGAGTELSPVDLPQDYYVLLVLPSSETKVSTEAVYAAFDERDGAKGFRNRRAALRRALEAVARPRDLAALPPNDLASSPVSDDLLELGAFRADVSGAGPAVYGLFMRREQAAAARKILDRIGRTWLTVPAWYG